MDVAEAIDAEAVSVGYRIVTPAFDQSTGKTPKTPGARVIIDAAVQPASGRQLKDLAEGARIEAQFIAWSRSVMVEDAQIQYPLDGEWFRIVYVWPRSADGFTRVAMGRLKT